MKRIMVIFLLFLSSCENVNSVDDTINVKYDDYEVEYPESKIEWNDIFKLKNDYFIYVYSLDCFYCKETKKHILEFYCSSPKPVYFILYKKEIPIGNRIEETIGASEIENVFIKGTPTLMLISDGKISLNVAGKNNVLELIDLYKKSI